jgi:hypothetical protein
MATVAIKTNPVNRFEIPVKALSRDQNFYEKVLDRKLTREDMDTLKMAFPPMEQGVPVAAGTTKKEIGEYGFIAHFERYRGEQTGLAFNEMSKNVRNGSAKSAGQ